MRKKPRLKRKVAPETLGGALRGETTGDPATARSAAPRLASQQALRHFLVGEPRFIDRTPLDQARGHGGGGERSQHRPVEGWRLAGNSIKKPSDEMAPWVDAASLHPLPPSFKRAPMNCVDSGLGGRL